MSGFWRPAGIAVGTLASIATIASFVLDRFKTAETPVQPRRETVDSAIAYSPRPIPAPEVAVPKPAPEPPPLEVKKEASIASEVLPSGSLFYLVFGPYGTQSEARQTNMMLTLRGFDSTIVRAPNSTAYEVVLGGQDSFALMESSSRKIAAINGEVGKVLPRVRDAVEQTARN